MSTQCETKLTFDTKKQADDAALVAAYQHGSKVRAYQCRTCKLWHLASQYQED